MPFDFDDPYVAVRCNILQTSARAVQVEDESGLKIWIPRSLLHGGQETEIEENIGEEILLKIRRWFAKREGLV